MREGRVLRSRTHHNNNNPEYNEEFTMLVDDPEHQGLRIIVKDDDIFGFSDKVLGVAEVPLKEVKHRGCKITSMHAGRGIAGRGCGVHGCKDSNQDSSYCTERYAVCYLSCKVDKACVTARSVCGLPADHAAGKLAYCNPCSTISS